MLILVFIELCRPPPHLQRWKVSILIVWWNANISFNGTLSTPDEDETIEVFQEFKRLGLLWDRRSSSGPDWNSGEPDQHTSHTG